MNIEIQIISRFILHIYRYRYILHSLLIHSRQNNGFIWDKNAVTHLESLADS